jgi:hypothetical protein
MIWLVNGITKQVIITVLLERARRLILEEVQHNNLLNSIFEKHAQMVQNLAIIKAKYARKKAMRGTSCHGRVRQRARAHSRKSAPLRDKALASTFKTLRPCLPP